MTHYSYHPYVPWVGPGLISQFMPFGFPFVVPRVFVGLYRDCMVTKFGTHRDLISTGTLLLLLAKTTKTHWMGGLHEDG